MAHSRKGTDVIQITRRSQPNGCARVDESTPSCQYPERYQRYQGSAESINIYKWFHYKRVEMSCLISIFKCVVIDYFFWSPSETWLIISFPSK